MYSELREYFCTKLFCSRWFACSIPLNSSTIIQNRDLIPVVQMTIFLDKFTMSVTKRTKIGPQDSLTTPSISHKMSQSQLITKLSFNLRTSLPHNFTCHCKGFLYFWSGTCLWWCLCYFNQMRNFSFISDSHDIVIQINLEIGEWKKFT